jgi:hypothetical protein
MESENEELDMAEKKPTEVNFTPSDLDQISKESQKRGQDRTEFISFVVRKETAVELLNALIVALGTVPGGGGGDLEGEESFEQGGDSTLGSDR